MTAIVTILKKKALEAIVSELRDRATDADIITMHYRRHEDHETANRYAARAQALGTVLGAATTNLTDFTPDELRRVADILESNSDQRGYDFWSAVAAMEAEDMESGD